MAFLSYFEWFGDDFQQNQIGYRVTADPVLGTILTFQTVRDLDCVYHNIYIGLGPNGSPETTQRQFYVPDSGSTILLPVLRQMGVNNMDDVNGRNGQITAGP